MHLLVRAAARGVVDFSKQTRDKTWSIRLRLLLEEMHAGDRLQELALQQTKCLAMLRMASAVENSEAYGRIADKLQDIERRAFSMVRPWSPYLSQTDIEQRAAADARKQYEDVIGGSLDDPEIQQRVQLAADRLLAVADEGREEITADDLANDPEARRINRQRKGLTRRRQRDA